MQNCFLRVIFVFVQLQCEDKRNGRASEGHKQGQSEEEEEGNQMPVYRYPPKQQNISPLHRSLPSRAIETQRR
jgi:hypothetical protein